MLVDNMPSIEVDDMSSILLKYGWWIIFSYLNGQKVFY